MKRSLRNTAACLSLAMTIVVCVQPVLGGGSGGICSMHLKNRTGHTLPVQYRWEGQDKWRAFCAPVAAGSDSSCRFLSIGGRQAKRARIYLRATAREWTGYAKLTFVAIEGGDYFWRIRE